MELTTNNPLLCDIETGVCEIPGLSTDTKTGTEIPASAPVKIIYFTDPICSSCWGIEPQLRRLKLEYGQYIEVEYRMGGLLPDWSYNSGGISKPSDVASHWDEVSLHYDMPIDGDVWLEDPLHSSYPPSIAFKAAQLQDTDKAVYFLRELREMLFLKKQNITKWENLAAAAAKVGLDTVQLESDFNGKANELFKEDLALAAQLGVRGFPTLFFVNAQGDQQKVYGTKPYSVYEAALLEQMPAAAKKEIDTKWDSLFGKYSSLTAREFAGLSNIPRNEAEVQLRALTGEGKLTELATKNGSMWTVVP
ncbi:ClpXP adapter SpxH family protein [Dyadobacter sp. Leaf189]|uniref:ClpXP adapter SpxH family protein n=1 Tax=Dyadobacter sp. Leaf189 TaxID=1736295 RepID=UPI0006FD74EC|nr:ClpXP adapter SpxH family protein [Dyadobacter sp. Leaf189]KQS30719.1 dithiol-disulfide isomerase [Dyadobacter sp. Leaf189]